jgi:hypothetical protein
MSVMRDEVLLDIATFLVRRWSEKKDVVVRIDPEREPSVSLQKNLVTLPNLNHYYGSDFDRYRQWRIGCWRQAMKMKHSNKSLSNDYAHGFLLSCLEDRRVQEIGMKDWPGMQQETVFNDAVSWYYEPSLTEMLPRRYRILLAFGQYFRNGMVKGDVDSHMLDIVEEAASFAHNIVKESVQNNHKTDWIEKHIPILLKRLEVDALLNIPLFKGERGMSAKEDEISRLIQKILKERDMDEDVKVTMEGKDVRSEYEQLQKETRKVVKSSSMQLDVDISVPERVDVDTSQLYDNDLINKLKAEFRSWKTGWVEQHGTMGEEFDTESYVERSSRVFFLDVKVRFKARIAILLDHSSSIADMELPYKRAMVALCKALDYIGANCIVFAFNTQKNRVRCWLVKPADVKWTNICSARLAQVYASGGTPLSEVYEHIMPVIERFKPDIFLTLTDGEPNDPSSVRDAIVRFRRNNVNMVSVGIGNNITEAVSIAKKLENLDYDRSVAVSDLREMPKKILYLLQ